MTERLHIALLGLCAAAVVSCGKTIPDIHTMDMDAYTLNQPVRKISVKCENYELDYSVKFQKDGQIASITLKNADGSYRNTTNYIYNKDGLLHETIRINAEKETEARYTYEYDSCFVSRRTLFGMNTNEISRWDNSNDGTNIIRSEFFNEGELESVTEWTYGENTREEIAFDKNGTCLGTAHYEYASKDKPCRIVSEDVDLDIEISYDEHMLPVWSRNVLINSDGSFGYNDMVVQSDTIYYSYVFDRRGNWIRRADSSSTDGEAFNTINRSIRY